MPIDYSKFSDQALQELSSDKPNYSKFTDAELSQIAGGSSQNNIEQPRSDWDAFKYGMKNSITANLVHGLERTSGIQLPEMISIPEGYKPETLEEHVASMAGSLIDPVALAIPAGKGVTLAQHLAKTAIAGGMIGAGQAASEQFAQGQYNVSDIIKSGAFGTALGAGLGGLTRMLPSSKAGIIEKEAMQVFEKPEVKALTSLEGKESERVKEILGIQRAKFDTQKEFDSLAKRASDESISPSYRQTLTEKMAEKNLELEGINADIARVVESDSYKVVHEAQQGLLSHFGTDQEGKVYDVLDNLVSSKNKLLDPKFMAEAYNAGDVSAKTASAWGWKDIGRIFESKDGSIRGWFKQHFYEPAVSALTRKESEEITLLKGYEAVVKALPDSSKTRRAELVSILEGKADDLKVNTKPEEDAWLNWMRKNFSDMRNRINEVRIRNGLDPIGKIEKYFPHAEELDMLTQWGLKNPQELKGIVSPLTKKEISSPFFKKRSGELTDYIKEDPDAVVRRYVSNALNAIHMTDVASELQAKSTALLNAPNMRTTIDRWVNSAVMRGLDPKDQSFIQNGYQNALKFIGKATNLYSAGVLLGNLNIVLQQPSQMLATLMSSGLRSTLKGTAMMFNPAAKEIEKASQFLAGRAFKSELPQFSKNIFKKYTDFVGAVTGWADQGVARASWHAAFDKAKLNNLSDKAAVRYADVIAQKLHASYNELNKPAILRGQVGRAFFPFQTFTFNLWNLLMSDNKALAELQGISKTRQFGQMVGSLYATNLFYRSLGLPEPFEMQGVPTQAGTVGLPPIPLVGSARGGLPSPVLNIPYKEMQGALGLASGDTDKLQGTLFGNLLKAAFTDDGEERQKSLIDAGRFGVKFLASGQQLANFTEGLNAVSRGYVKKGREEVAIESPIVATLFGPRKTREYKSAVNEDKRMRVRRILGLE